jgi:hypothetical protein
MYVYGWGCGILMLYVGCARGEERVWGAGLFCGRTEM